MKLTRRPIGCSRRRFPAAAAATSVGCPRQQNIRRPPERPHPPTPSLLRLWSGQHLTRRLLSQRNTRRGKRREGVDEAGTLVERSVGSSDLSLTTGKTTPPLPPSFLLRPRHETKSRATADDPHLGRSVSAATCCRRRIRQRPRSRRYLPRGGNGRAAAPLGGNRSYRISSSPSPLSTASYVPHFRRRGACAPAAASPLAPTAEEVEATTTTGTATATATVTATAKRKITTNAPPP